MLLLQCSLDKTTDLRRRGWGRYRQRGRYFQGFSSYFIQTGEASKSPFVKLCLFDM